MRIREEKLYTFDELSDAAQERARDWFREGMDIGDWGAENVLEDAARLGAIIGIDINTRPVKLMGGGTRQEPNVYWSVGGRDNGCTFAGTYRYIKSSVAALEQEAPSTYNGQEQKGNTEINRIARELQGVQARNFYQLTASTSHGHSRNFTMDIDVDRSDDVNVSEDDTLTVRELLMDFASWIEQQLEAEYEYRMSNEVVDENIRANEYEFTEDGRRA